jgi:hypothetical protein
VPSVAVVYVRPSASRVCRTLSAKLQFSYQLTRRWLGAGAESQNDRLRNISREGAEIWLSGHAPVRHTPARRLDPHYAAPSNANRLAFYRERVHRAVGHSPRVHGMAFSWDKPCDLHCLRARRRSIVASRDIRPIPEPIRKTECRSYLSDACHSDLARQNGRISEGCCRSANLDWIDIRTHIHIAPLPDA